MKRLEVRKTYKLLVAGAFVRTESGRAYPATGERGVFLAHVPLGSRKDVRDAVKAARGAFAGWAGRTAYNRGQILYRAAEMLEERSAEFVDAIRRSTGAAAAPAKREVATAVDRLVHFAGWADKLGAVLGTVNPVAAPYFNFSTPEPTGVVGVICPESPSLLPLVSRVSAAMVSGNTVVAIGPEKTPIPALLFGEVVGTSDVPSGAVNILSGRKGELVPAHRGHELRLIQIGMILGLQGQQRLGAEMNRLVEQRGGEVGDADMARLALPFGLGQRRHGLAQRNVRVGPMNEQQVDATDVKRGEARIDRTGKVGAAQIFVADFGGDE